MKLSLLLVGALVLFAGGWYARARVSSCVVGVTGAEASVTITGMRSGAACDALVASSPRAYYRRESAPDGGVLCEIPRGSVRYVVRDRGAMMLVGRGLCAGFENEARTQP